MSPVRGGKPRRSACVATNLLRWTWARSTELGVFVHAFGAQDGAGRRAAMQVFIQALQQRICCKMGV